MAAAVAPVTADPVPPPPLPPTGDESMPPFGRRVSQRLTGTKRPFYGYTKPEPESPSPAKKVTGKKKGRPAKAGFGSRVLYPAPVVDRPVHPACESVEGEASTELVGGTSTVEGGTSTEIVEGAESVQGGTSMELVDFGDVVAMSEEGSTPEQRVKQTLRLFNKHYLHFVQEEEKRREEVTNTLKLLPLEPKVLPLEPKAKGKKYQKQAKVVADGSQVLKRASKRPDLKAVSKMKNDQTILYSRKRIGHLPGIHVGDQFFSRAEMAVLGLHAHWLSGIDYMGIAYGKKEYKNYKFPLAVGIVMSGQYEDDCDNAEDVIYTGQGGHDLLGNKKQIADQILERGNLALKNCMVCNVPVRVVRGHDSVNSYCGKVYTYDGLYMVQKYWAEKGVAGFTIFKFRLTRVVGQPPLTTTQVFFTRAQAPLSISEMRGLVCEDISGGQENYPVPVTNIVDDQPFAPIGFVYSKSIQLAKDIEFPQNCAGCNCKGDCINYINCACRILNDGSDFAYVQKNGGRIVEPKAVVIECGPNCGCNQSCINRTSQKGLRFRLEVFRTPTKGWAVRSWDSIPSGSPICEYTGTLNKADFEKHPDDTYLFDIDCLQTMKGLDGRMSRAGDASLHTNFGDKKNEAEYAIDASTVGNISRFINHSCQPNLYVQCVLSSHRDITMARVMLFAYDNIPPLQELTYDYGYILDSVVRPDGTVKKLPCYCGATCCRKWLY